MNDSIMDIYLSKIIPSICEQGDDQQHGSSVNADVAALQAISKRVHYGKFVAEAKFLQSPELYLNAISLLEVYCLSILLDLCEIHPVDRSARC